MLVSAWHLLCAAWVLSVADMGTTTLAVLVSPVIFFALLCAFTAIGGRAAMRKHLAQNITISGCAVLVVWTGLIFYNAVNIIYNDRVSSNRAIYQISLGKTDLNWDDGIYIESAFLTVPKPCYVQLTGTDNYSDNSRNILAHIISQNGSCTVIEMPGDASQAAPSVDSTTPSRVTGLVVRTAPSFGGADQLYQMLRGDFCPVERGNRMPPNSPPNLIWITVGDGYPWNVTSKCQAQ